MRPTTKLRQLLASGRTVVAPGVFDGLSARLTEQAGFAAVYASGGAIARSAGVPDLGLLSLSEIVARLEMIGREDQSVDALLTEYLQQVVLALLRFGGVVDDEQPRHAHQTAMPPRPACY